MYSKRFSKLMAMVMVSGAMVMVSGAMAMDNNNTPAVPVQPQVQPQAQPATVNAPDPVDPKGAFDEMSRLQARTAAALRVVRDENVQLKTDLTGAAKLLAEERGKSAVFQNAAALAQAQLAQFHNLANGLAAPAQQGGQAVQPAIQPANPAGQTQEMDAMLKRLKEQRAEAEALGVK